MGRQLALLFLLLIGHEAYATVASCPVTSGSLTLSVTMPRNAGQSPFGAFLDATATTDTSVADSVVQGVVFTWNFGDPGASGKGNWAYGVQGAYTSKNIGSGIIGAHIYKIADGSGDTNRLAIVTATDAAGNTATCGFGLTVYDPIGANGWTAANTYCIFNATVGTGCPTGANQITTSSVVTALASMAANKRYLFKCGDTFTGGAGVNIYVTKVQIGAYGGCQDTQTSRPIFTNTSGNHIFNMDPSSGNVTFSDFDCEGGTTAQDAAYGECIDSNQGTGTNAGIFYQITMYNILSNEVQSIFINACSQCFLQQFVMPNFGNTQNDTWLGVYWNSMGHSGFPATGSTFNNVSYHALIGNYFSGSTTYFANNAELVRMYGEDHYVVSNNTFNYGGPSYAVLKMMDGQPCPCPNIGGDPGDTFLPPNYTQYGEINDNLFTGATGANMVEMEPQNSASDERLRYIVVERNVFAPSGSQSSVQECVQTSIVSGVFRDNVCNLYQGQTWGFQFGQRGVEPVASSDNIYNNTIQHLGTAPGGGSAFIVLGGNGLTSAKPTSMNVMNNLGWGTTVGNYTMVSTNGGTGNTISNNTSTLTLNPGFVNASGTFLKLTDYKPTANYAGGTPVDNLFDAIGIPWSPTWDLGAVHH